MSEALAPSGPSVRTLAILIRVPPPSLACEEEHSNHGSHSPGCWVLCQPSSVWPMVPCPSLELCPQSEPSISEQMAPG